MRRVAPSMLAREQLQQLLADGADRESNIVSALVETVTRLVVQELLEGEQTDYLGGRGRYDRRGDDQVGSRNGYDDARARTLVNAFETTIGDREQAQILRQIHDLFLADLLPNAFSGRLLP